MDSLVIIDGVVLWVIVILAILMIFGFIFMGREYIETVRENDRLNRRLRQKQTEFAEVNRELIKTKAAYYRLTDKPLELK